MVDDPNAPAPASAPSVQDVGGGTLRAAPNTGGEPNPSVEEQAAEQARKAAGGGEEQPGQEQPQTPPPPPPSPPAAEEQPLKGTVFEGLSPEMQTKVAPYAAAFAENGTLTDAEVSEAAKATGFSEAAVRQFMAGAPAQAVANAKPILDVIGGQDQFGQFKEWTATEGNLTPAEQTAYNKALDAGDFDTASLVIKPAVDRWKADGGGKSARDVTAREQGSAGGAQAGDTYENWAQVEADMNKPQYQTDAAFRETVKQKINRSPNV